MKPRGIQIPGVFPLSGSRCAGVRQKRRNQEPQAQQNSFKIGCHRGRWSLADHRDCRQRHDWSARKIFLTVTRRGACQARPGGKLPPLLNALCNLSGIACPREIELRRQPSVAFRALQRARTMAGIQPTLAQPVSTLSRPNGSGCRRLSAYFREGMRLIRVTWSW